MSEMVFNNGSVPVAVAAKVYKKDPCWVRAGLIAGWLPIGFATRDGKLIKDIQQINSKFGRINYYISPKKLYLRNGGNEGWRQRYDRKFRRTTNIG